MGVSTLSRTMTNRGSADGRLDAVEDDDEQGVREFRAGDDERHWVCWPVMHPSACLAGLAAVPPRPCGGLAAAPPRHAAAPTRPPRRAAAGVRG